MLPLVEAAVPEWRATLDALLALPGIGGPVGDAGARFFARHLDRDRPPSPDGTP